MWWLDREKNGDKSKPPDPKAKENSWASQRLPQTSISSFYRLSHPVAKIQPKVPFIAEVWPTLSKCNLRFSSYNGKSQGESTGKIKTVALWKLGLHFWKKTGYICLTVMHKLPTSQDQQLFRFGKLKPEEVLLRFENPSEDEVNTHAQVWENESLLELKTITAWEVVVTFLMMKNQSRLSLKL